MSQNYYTAFTVNTGQVPSSQSNFPVLLLPTDNRFRTIANGGHVASSSGFDLRPYSDTALTTALTFQLVPSTYNASTGFFEMWVHVPSLSDGYTIYLGYGDPALTSDGSSNTTWDSNFTGVYHLANGSTLSATDSSQSSLNGTINGATAGSGQIDGCGSFVAASSQDIGMGDVNGLSGNITVSGWVKPSSTGAQVVVGRLDATANNNQDYVLFQSSNHWNMQSGDSTQGFLTIASSQTVSTTVWAFVVGVFILNSPNNQVKIYVNASVTNSGTSNISPTNVSGQKLAIGSNSETSLFFDGLIDEVRISNIARSQDWITTEYNNQNSPGTFYSIGAEQGLLMGAIML